MHSFFVSRITVGAALALALLIVIAAAGLQSISRLQRDAQEFERATDLDTRLERLLSFVKDAETGARGFIITGEERFLEPYVAAQRHIPAAVAGIRGVTVDEGQLARLEEVVPLIERDLALMETNIQARRREGFVAAQRRVRAGTVKATTDSIHASFAVIRDASHAIVAERHRKAQSSIVASRRLIFTGMALATLLGFAGVYALNRGLKAAALAARDRAQFFDLPLDMLCVAQPDGVFREVNGAWGSTLGYTLEELCSRPFIEFVHPDDREKTTEQFVAILGGERAVLFQNRYEHKDGNYRNLLWSAVLEPEANLVYATARDITAYVEAQSEVQQLSGMLPICAWCKNIRNDEGYWQGVETYLGERSEAQFTHGICPSCSLKAGAAA